MPIAIREKMSWVPFQIEIMFENEHLGIGTAFAYLYEDKTCLITNWHNVSGRNSETLKVINKEAAIPNKLILHYPIDMDEDKSTPGAPARIIVWNSFELNLYEDGEPIWYEHPIHRNKVDAVAIPFSLEASNLKPANAEELDLESIILRPSLDVYVLGYPRGMTGGAKLPIWKRGSIASEPDFDLDNLPKFFIDTATREGMSGSPVYAQQSGYIVPEGGAGVDDAIFGEARRFAGIYSGRVGDDTFKAQLGIVWKEDAIVEIILGSEPSISSFEI
ncbi:trypsin-like peptidase domain-containing protein [Natronospirillum operosum]|uniref:trypsin-like peptidase domain-containing protein n=1 Tax=Natronospirillum operosum TaxID=2759953 RepID=UPI00197BB9A5|nr:trypsin-like peptidase domain-containing protein [Natronospirillum operosum]